MQSPDVYKDFFPLRLLVLMLCSVCAALLLGFEIVSPYAVPTRGVELCPPPTPAVALALKASSDSKC